MRQKPAEFVLATMASLSPAPSAAVSSTSPRPPAELFGALQRWDGFDDLDGVRLFIDPSFKAMLLYTPGSVCVCVLRMCLESVPRVCL